MRLLLGSGGYSTKERWLKFASDVNNFLGDVKEVLFIPFAVGDYDSSIERMAKAGFCSGRPLIGIHKVSDMKEAVKSAQAIYIQGGNSFRLANDMHRHGLLEPIRERVRNGMPYLGASAGSNIACPTIKTTNDMPIVHPPSLDGLGLVNFQINPHYFSGKTHIKREDSYLAYGGETRDNRIEEFHEVNDIPVLGLWEGVTLTIEGNKKQLSGTDGARLFEKGKEPKDIEPNADLSKILP